MGGEAPQKREEGERKEEKGEIEERGREEGREGGREEGREGQRQRRLISTPLVAAAKSMYKKYDTLKMPLPLPPQMKISG